MTTDLRAALRAAAEMLARVKPIDLNVGDDPHGLAARCRALADAPPTVAELLAALPEPPGGRGRGMHRVEWKHDDMWIRAVRYGLAGLVVERLLDGEWSRTNLNHADLNQPATLVEVSP